MNVFYIWLLSQILSERTVVLVYMHEWSLEIYYAGQLVETVTRLIGKDVHRINYRHVIDSLLRKPGGFRCYRYRGAHSRFHARFAIAARGEKAIFLNCSHRPDL